MHDACPLWAVFFFFEKDNAFWFYFIHRRCYAVMIWKNVRYFWLHIFSHPSQNARFHQYLLRKKNFDLPVDRQCLYVMGSFYSICGKDTKYGLKDVDQGAQIFQKSRPRNSRPRKGDMKLGLPNVLFFPTQKFPSGGIF
jgi:hypothetical protein